MERRLNRRGIHRRYSDRRVAALLRLYEILYHEPPGEQRNLHILEALRDDYQTDRAGFATEPANCEAPLKLLACSGDWGTLKSGSCLESPGLCSMLCTHRDFDGALTLSRFKRPSMISLENWDRLWETDLSAPATALLSVPIRPRVAPPTYLWLAMNGASREWSSHDRDLSEEVSALLAVSFDRS